MVVDMFCFQCGYDLSGLELPRPCPECGTIRDPEQDAIAARKWFATASAVFDWPLRRSRVPLGVHHLLDDAASNRIALRRRLLWLVLPNLLLFLLVVLGMTIRLEFVQNGYYYAYDDPLKQPVLHYEEYYTAPLLNPGPEFIEAEKTNKDAFRKERELFKSGTFTTAGQQTLIGFSSWGSWQLNQYYNESWIYPVVFILIGYAVSHVALCLTVRRNAIAPDKVATARSIRKLDVLAAAPLAVVCWAGVGLLVIRFLCTLTALPADMRAIASVASFGLAIIFAMYMPLGIYLLVRRDKAKRTVPQPLATSLTIGILQLLVSITVLLSRHLFV